MGFRLRKYVFVACACIMFLSVILTGCELLETKSDYINVTVELRSAVIQNNMKDGKVVSSEFVAGAPVTLSITKADGEKSEWVKDTDAQGNTITVAATFKVYREQEIDTLARLQYSTPIFEPQNVANYETFEWEIMWLLAGEEMGGSCTVSSYLPLVVEREIPSE